MSKKTIDPNKKHYFAEVDPSEVDGIIAKARAEEVEILIWEQGKSEGSNEKYRISQYSPETKIVSLTSSGGLLSKLASTSKLMGKEIFVKIGSGKFQFFTTSLLEQKQDSKEPSFKLSRQMFKTLQRENYRLHASTSVKIQFRINEAFLYNALDVSAGGTAIVIPIEEKDQYPKDKVFKNCRLGVNTGKFDIAEAKVVGQWPMKDNLGNETNELKVGIAFQNLTSDTEEELFKLINSEARAEEVRKMLLEKKRS